MLFHPYKWSQKNLPPVNQHSNGISPCSIGNTSSKGPFSIAMLVYQGVLITGICPIFADLLKHNREALVDYTHPIRPPKNQTFSGSKKNSLYHCIIIWHWPSRWISTCNMLYKQLLFHIPIQISLHLPKCPSFHPPTGPQKWQNRLRNVQCRQRISLVHHWTIGRP